jgi:hypothetical protein
VIIAFFMVLMVAIAAFGYQRYARPGQVYEQLGEPVIEAPTAGSPEDAEARKAARVQDHPAGRRTCCRYLRTKAR